MIQSIDGFNPRAPVFLHLNTHGATILWFWAPILANAIPVPSSSFSTVAEHRQKHIQGLCALLESPVCLTTTGDAGTIRLRSQLETGFDRNAKPREAAWLIEGPDHDECSRQ